jgi:hypothetical protein
MASELARRSEVSAPSRLVSTLHRQKRLAKLLMQLLVQPAPW